MILEGIVTTLQQQRVHVTPMGPCVHADDWTRLELRPYQTSQTYKNLLAHPEGVLHVTDDVLLIARAAVGRLETPELVPADQIKGFRLKDTCRWYEFRIAELDNSEPRTRIGCEVVGSGRVRDFFGFNRGKHAVVEAAILATRLSFLPADQIRQDVDRLGILVDKTGGSREKEAFQFLADFIESSLPGEKRD